MTSPLGSFVCSFVLLDLKYVICVNVSLARRLCFVTHLCECEFSTEAVLRNPFV
jgi:hypothetical protein